MCASSTPLRRVDEQHVAGSSSPSNCTCCAARCRAASSCRRPDHVGLVLVVRRDHLEADQPRAGERNRRSRSAPFDLGLERPASCRCLRLVVDLQRCRRPAAACRRRRTWLAASSGILPASSSATIAGRPCPAPESSARTMSNSRPALLLRGRRPRRRKSLRCRGSALRRGW